MSRFYEECTNNNSTRYGADEKDALSPTLIEGEAEAHSEQRYVEANKAPVMHCKNLQVPISPSKFVWKLQ